MQITAYATQWHRDPGFTMEAFEDKGLLAAREPFLPISAKYILVYFMKKGEKNNDL